MKPASGHLDVSTEELEALLERARQQPLTPNDYEKPKAAIRTLGYITELLENREVTLEKLRRLLCQSSTEKTDEVLKRAGIEVDEKDHKSAGQRSDKTAPPGHGRNGAAVYAGACKVQIQHTGLTSGDQCPDCERGKVYAQRDSGMMVRIKGRPPIDATIYELERLRCNLCGKVFTAEAPDGMAFASVSTKLFRMSSTVWRFARSSMFRLISYN